MKDLRLFTRQEAALTLATEGDLKIEARDLTFVDESRRVAQQMRIRLCSFRGEWFLQRSYGLPYFEEILVKGPLLDRVSGLFYDALRTVPDVEQVTDLTFDLVASTRRLSIAFEAETNFGPLAETVSV